MKKIRSASFNIAIDERRSHIFLATPSRVNIFDLETDKKIAALKEINNPDEILISQKNNLLMIKSTMGHFGFYTLDDLSFIGKVCVKLYYTTSDCYYNEEENLLVGIGRKNMDQCIYCVSPDTLTYTNIPLYPLLKETQGGKKLCAVYELHRYSKGSFYMVRNDLYFSKEKGVYEGECCYGRFEKYGNTLVLREKIRVSTEKGFKLVDILEPEEMKHVYAFLKLLRRKSVLDRDPDRVEREMRALLKEYTAPEEEEIILKAIKDCGKDENDECFRKIYRGENGLIVLTDKGVYRQIKGIRFEEIYHIPEEELRENCVSDYMEHNGRRYIGTWSYCLVEDINQVT